MDELLVFLQSYGWQLALIALIGIVILGILKYCNVFKKFDEKIRHILYLVVSVGISIIGAVIYLACVGQFTIEYICVVAGAILALNQTFYTIYSNLSIKELFTKLVGWVKGLISSGKAQEIVDDIKEDITKDSSSENTEETNTDNSSETKE